MAITSEDWVPMISRPFNEATNVHDLLLSVGSIWTFRRFFGVIPHCVNACRYRAGQLKPKETTVAVDAESTIYAAAKACKNINDVPRTFFAMMKSMWKETLPNNFIIAFDSNRRIKREMFPEYKSGREPDDHVEKSKAMVIEQLKEKPVQVEIHDGYEADDILATIAFQSQIIQDNCILITTDKDMWQVLGPGTSMYNYKKKEHYSAQTLLAKHLIRPQQAVDWLVLVGKNDVKGANKIGPDFASRNLHAHGDIIGILDSDLTPAKREAIEKLDISRLREIHTLTRTLPVGRVRHGSPPHVDN